MTYKIMIVDDSMIIRNHITRLMSDPRLPRFEIVGLAGDGVRALAIAQEHSPDCVTMDLTMPNMDGETCIEQLAKLLPNTRILVISALSDKATALRALTKGAHGFLQKPFTDDAIVNALLELME